MTRFTKFAAALTILVLAGCQPPAVKTRTLRYAVSYSVDGVIYEASMEYKAYYEDLSYFSERGPEWHIRGNAPIEIYGTLRNGSRFSVQPATRETPGLTHPEIYFPDGSSEVKSGFFLSVDPTNSQLVEVDANHLNAVGHQIKILKETISLEHSGVGLFSSRKATERLPDFRPFYYTVASRVLTGEEIDRSGLRALLKADHAHWLRAGGTKVLDSWQNLDRSARVQLRSEIAQIYHESGPAEQPASFDKGVWQVSSGASSEAIPWAMQNGPWGMLWRYNRSGHLPNIAIRYQGCLIEIPADREEMNYFFDPASDSLLVLQLNENRRISTTPSVSSSKIMLRRNAPEIGA
jgi:hypothetical protein